MGQQFVAPAFITVVVGGATNVITGALGLQPAPVAGPHAGGLSVRRLPRPRRAAARRADHHPADAGRHLGLAAAAGSTSARGWPDRWAAGACSTDPRTSAVGPCSGSSSWCWSDFSPGIRCTMSEFDATNIAYYLLNIPMALGLCLLWGYCGILSFGQVAYFGIAGYLYGIIAGNLMGNPLGAADRLARQSRRLRCGRCRVRLLRVLRPGADVDRTDPHPGLHAAARDLPRPDRRLSVACRHRAARRLQRDDRHPVVPAR